MIRVGLTGGYATGKSLVAAELAHLGCHVVSADTLGHQILEPGGVAYAPVVDRFGRQVLDKESRIDRKRLGALVFSSPESLDALNRIVHPAVFQLEEEFLAAAQAHDPQGIAVVEAAILIETGRYRVYDRIILTACDEQTQVARGMKRDGLSAEQVRARLQNQMPLSEKKPLANYVIDTDGSIDDTLQQVRAVYEDLNKL